MPRKTRPDAKLQSLPAEQRQRIVDFARETTLEETVAWIEDKEQSGLGLPTSRSALSRFLSWQALQEQVGEAKLSAQAAADALREMDPEVTSGDLFRVSQIVFQNRALAEGDTKLYASLANIFLRERQLANETKRLELLEKKAAQAEEAEGVAKSDGLSAEEKARRLKEIFGL